MNGEFIVGNEQDEACTHRTYTYMGSRHSTCAVLAASPHDALNTHAYRTGHDSKHIEREREKTAYMLGNATVLRLLISHGYCKNKT